MMYGVDTRIERAVLGSAGWYTFLNNEPFPYGTKFMPIDRNRYEWFLTRQVLFLLGEEDNDPNHSSLNSSLGAKNQGKHRYDRGVNYFNSMIAFGEEFEIPFRPDHGHKILNDFNSNTHPGYPLLGRMKGVSELRGVIASLKNCIERNNT